MFLLLLNYNFLKKNYLNYYNYQDESLNKFDTVGAIPLQ